MPSFSEVVAEPTGVAWPVAAVSVLLAVWQWWKNRKSGTPQPSGNPILDAAAALLLALLQSKTAPSDPVKPVDPPAPAPAIPDEHKRPLIDALLKLLGISK